MKQSVECSLIVTVKNRLSHFMQTFPFNVTQTGIDYELIYVNFNSEDNFSDHLIATINKNKSIFSPRLKIIKEIVYSKNTFFNPRESKNLGVKYTSKSSKYLIFNDVDTMLGMSYLKKWTSFIEENVSFATNRIQETRASHSTRIDKLVNYGNLIVGKKDYLSVGGFDESDVSYGGDDDDLFHRLKLSGLREINPYTADCALQYSILHDDSERLSEFKIKKRKNTKLAFKKIYENKEIKSNKSNFLNNVKNLENYISEEIRYELS